MIGGMIVYRLFCLLFFIENLNRLAKQIHHDLLSCISFYFGLACGSKLNKFHNFIVDIRKFHNYLSCSILFICIDPIFNTKN